jgi:hypothetical protein
VSTNRYRRFARAPSFSIATRPSLWIGEDHLLMLENSGITENYCRVYWRDFQALVWYETPVRLILSIAIMTFAAGFCGLACLAQSEPIAMWILLGVAACFGIVLSINLARGPTCACFVQTATTFHRLQAVARVKQARRLEALALERVPQYQAGNVTPPPSIPFLQTPTPTDLTTISPDIPPPLPTAIQAEVRTACPPPLTLDRSYLRLHEAFFATALTSAVLSAIIAIGCNNMVLTVTAAITGAAQMGLVIVGLIRARHLPDAVGLVRIYWFALAMAILSAVAGYVHLILLMTTNAPGSAVGGQADYLRALSRLNGSNSAWMLVSGAVSAIIDGLIGVLGLLQLKRMHTRWRLLSMPMETNKP